jgi:hypothetical protein
MKESSEKRRSQDSKKVNTKGREGERVTLYPLKPEEAMRAILQAPPESKDKGIWNKDVSRRKKR